MTHEALHTLLTELGWTRVDRADGRVDHYYSEGPCDRMLATIPECPLDALCETRGGGRSQAALDDAARWAREAVAS